MYVRVRCTSQGCLLDVSICPDTCTALSQLDPKSNPEEKMVNLQTSRSRRLGQRADMLHCSFVRCSLWSLGASEMSLGRHMPYYVVFAYSLGRSGQTTSARTSYASATFLFTTLGKIDFSITMRKEHLKKSRGYVLLLFSTRPSPQASAIHLCNSITRGIWSIFRFLKWMSNLSIPICQEHESYG